MQPRQLSQYSLMTNIRAVQSMNCGSILTESKKFSYPLQSVAFYSYGTEGCFSPGERREKRPTSESDTFFKCSPLMPSWSVKGQQYSYPIQKSFLEKLGRQILSFRI